MGHTTTHLHLIYTTRTILTQIHGRHLLRDVLVDVGNAEGVEWRCTSTEQQLGGKEEPHIPRQVFTVRSRALSTICQRRYCVMVATDQLKGKGLNRKGKAGSQIHANKQQSYREKETSSFIHPVTGHWWTRTRWIKPAGSARQANMSTKCAFLLPNYWMLLSYYSCQ